MALYVFFMSYITQNKQNCFIDEVCMKARGRGGGSSQKRASIVLVTSFFLKVHERETRNQKTGLFHRTYRSSHQMCPIKKGVVLWSFTKLTRKHLWQSLFFFLKKETLAQVSSCEFCEISKNTFLQSTSGRLFLYVIYGWHLSKKWDNKNFCHQLVAALIQ